MKRKTAFLTTALAGALAAASAAHAVDVKVYPGNACQAQRGNQAADFAIISAFIINVGGFKRGVLCPIVRDNHANLSGVKAVGVRVRSDGVEPLTCTLLSFTSLGDLRSHSRSLHRRRAHRHLAPRHRLPCNALPGRSPASRRGEAGGVSTPVPAQSLPSAAASDDAPDRERGRFHHHLSVSGPPGPPAADG